MRSLVEEKIKKDKNCNLMDRDEDRGSQLPVLTPKKI
jgi:hypothetical protein